MAEINSNQITFVDLTDSRKLDIYINSNLPTTQIYNSNTETYSPDWSKTNLQLTADIYLDSKKITPETIEWCMKVGTTETPVGSNRILTVSTNVLSTNPIITYICRVEYQRIQAFREITFMRADTGLNGSDGENAPVVVAQYSADGVTNWTSTLNTVTHKYIRHSYDGGKTWSGAIKMVGEDGTSVKILGTATSVTKVSGTDYYTLVYNSASLTSAELGDAYLYGGDLYVCADSRDGQDYFINVGNIQGPSGNDGKSSYVFIRYATDANGTNISTSPTGKTYMGVYTSDTNVAPTTANSYTWSKFVGDSAKSIVLSGDSQVFKVSQSDVVTPSTIKVTAQAFNTSITNWTYSTNGGQTFLSTVPTGVSRNGNVVAITGSTITSNSIVIKASDGEISDVFTIYKAIDGTDGAQGAPAPIAFLTNENVTFSANAQGQIATTTITSNVVAYIGTTKVTPTVGTISGVPNGMTITPSTITSTNEVMLTITIANNATLGSTSSNMGVISVPITYPISTVLYLTWSKVNSGAIGVGIKSTTVTYGVSNSASTKPADTAWQSTIPTVSEGQYLWTRTIIDYTDDSIADTVTYTYVKQGTKGDNGSAGSSVTVSSIQYQEGTSATVPPTNTWSNSVVSVADGKFLWTKTEFSDGKIAYGVARQGVSGTNASLVNIIPSAYYFKSTTGKDGTFTPEYIYVYPRFQNVTFGKWEYSIDGGVTWVAASGANGLTISTYNSVANTLRIARTSTLYTDTVTSISFRCMSSNSAIYDTVSIAKIYDVVDLRIGGRNLLKWTKDLPITTTNNGPNGISTYNSTSGLLQSTNDGIKLTFNGNTNTSLSIPLVYDGCVQNGEIITLSFDYRGNITDLGQFYFLQRTSPNVSFSLNSKAVLIANETDWQHCEVTFSIPSANERVNYQILLFYALSKYTSDNWIEIKKKSLKLEVGNKATDWSPAPEDIDANIEKVDTRITSVEAGVKTTTDAISSRVSSTEQSITTINGNVSSLSTKVSAAEQKITSDAIVSTVRQSTDYINDLGKKVGTTEIISKINQTAESVTISANKIGLLGATNIPDLTADKIKGGTLTLGGSSATTQSGQLLVKNASNVDMLKLNKDGIVVKSGHLAVASDFANSTYNWSTNTWTTTTNTSQLDLGDDYIRMGIYSPSGYTNYMRLLENGLHFQGNAQGIGSWGSFIGHDEYGDFVIQDTVRGYIVFKGQDDDTEIANISGSGLSVKGVYSNTIASSANVHINSYGQFYRSTSSSQRYKTDIQDIRSEELNPERLYDLPVREFKFKEGYLSDEDSCVNTFVPGFIAEEVAEIYPIACEYDGDKPENWNIRFIVPAMLKLIQDQNKKIEALEEQINNKAVN